MTTYDIDIELPPLPTINVMGVQRPQIWFTAGEVDVLRRAAIEADRKRRCEPVSKIDPNPPQLSIVWHDRPESVDRAMWEQAAIEAGVTYEELIEGTSVGETEDGEVLEFTHEQ